MSIIKLVIFVVESCTAHDVQRTRREGSTVSSLAVKYVHRKYTYIHAGARACAYTHTMFSMFLFVNK